ncbi:MAG: DMT family transporter [Microbacteriaceae bacterium]|nr:DMT family transporter [Burkholderiaceae bacterium]
MSDRKTRLDAVAISSLVLCCALWGLNHSITKLTLADVPPLVQAGLRSLGAAVLVALWAALRGLSLSPRNGTLAGGLLAGALFAAEFAAIFIGLQYTLASRMIVFIYLAPFVVALGMPLVAASERPTPRQLLGLAAAFAGVAWAFGEALGSAGAGAGSRQWLGDAMGVLAAVLWGATTLAIRGSRLASASPEQTLFYQLAVSGVLLTSASWATGEAWPALSSLGAQPLGFMAFQTVVITFASYLLWFWLVRHYPATAVTSFTLLTPLFGLLTAVWLLDEPLTLRLGVACAAVVTGIALVNRPPRPG